MIGGEVECFERFYLVAFAFGHQQVSVGFIGDKPYGIVGVIFSLVPNILVGNAYFVPHHLHLCLSTWCFFLFPMWAVMSIGLGICIPKLELGNELRNLMRIHWKNSSMMSTIPKNETAESCKLTKRDTLSIETLDSWGFRSRRFMGLSNGWVRKGLLLSPDPASN